jgi:hypothetical protein
MLVIVVLVLTLRPNIFGKKEPDKPDPKPGPPPIEFSFRKSQIPLKGMVAGIRNSSKTEELSNFVVRVRSADEEGERSHRPINHLKPRDSFTVGWAELDGWKLKPGDVLTVTCDQYQGEVSVTISEP